MERERQEREKELEKERQEQALHNHFEKSLRAAQQRVSNNSSVLIIFIQGAVPKCNLKFTRFWIDKSVNVRRTATTVCSFFRLNNLESNGAILASDSVSVRQNKRCQVTSEVR